MAGVTSKINTAWAAVLHFTIGNGSVSTVAGFPFAGGRSTRPVSCSHARSPILLMHKYDIVRNYYLEMNLHTFRHSTGDVLQVTVDIRNHSTRSVKPRIIIYEKQSFFAQRARKVHTTVIQKEKVESVASCSRETVTRLIGIPADLPASILNSAIIKLEYRLKVTPKQQ